MNWNQIQKKIITENQNERRRIEFIEAKSTGMSSHSQNNSSHSNNNTKKSVQGNVQKKKNSEGIYSEISVVKYSRWENIRRAGPGMFNHGNTCFLNSTLQCLVHTAPLVQTLMQDPIAIKGFGGKQDGQNTAILLLFKRLLEEVWASSTPKAVSPRMMVNTIRRISRQFRPYQQEDAHEYLRQLLDTMNNEILKINHLPIYGQSNPPAPGVVNLYETTLISRIFTGKLCNILTCSKCKYRSKTWNSFQDLSLNVGSGVKSVQDSVNLFIKSEKLEAGNEWLCDGCKKKVLASKQMTISNAPIVLVLHLKRFSFGNMFDKIKKHIDFPLTYDLPILTENNERTKVSYELYGIIVHHGHSVNSGHYIAYVKASNGQWYEMDDSSVSQVSINTVLKQQAYILFYLQSDLKIDQIRSSEIEKKSSDQLNSELDDHNEALQKRKLEEPRKPIQAPPVVQHEESDDELGEVLFLAKKQKMDVTGILESMKNKNPHQDCPPSPTGIPLDRENLTRLPPRRFGIFRFKGKIGKFRQWTRNSSLHSAFDDIVPDDWIVPHDNESDEESEGLESDKESTDDESSESDSEDSQTDSDINRRPEVKLGIRSTKQDLIKLSMRGRDVGGEGIWDDPNGNSQPIVPHKVLESIQSTEKAIRRNEQKESQKRKPTEWDSMLDSGRQKKIKTGRPNSLEAFLKEGDKENKFQIYQNHIRGTSGGEKEHYLKQWDSLKKEKIEKTEEDEWADPKRDQFHSKGFQNDHRGGREPFGKGGRGGSRGGRGNGGRGRGNSGRGGFRGGMGGGRGNRGRTGGRNHGRGRGQNGPR